MEDSELRALIKAFIERPIDRARIAQILSNILETLRINRKDERSTENNNSKKTNEEAIMAKQYKKANKALENFGKGLMWGLIATVLFFATIFAMGYSGTDGGRLSEIFSSAVCILYVVSLAAMFLAMGAGTTFRSVIWFALSGWRFGTRYWHLFSVFTIPIALFCFCVTGGLANAALWVFPFTIPFMTRSYARNKAEEAEEYLDAYENNLQEETIPIQEEGRGSGPKTWYCPDCGRGNSGKFCAGCGRMRPTA